MLKKSRKNQILKEIKISECFKDDEDFYIAVSVDNNMLSAFNVVSLSAIILPEFFLNKGNASRDEISLNEGYKLNSKPLFIKKNAINKDTFLIDDVESSSTSNNIFKLIYSKNIVSSCGQTDFLSYNLPIFSNEEQGITTKFIKIPLSIVREKTVKIFNISGRAPVEQPLNFFIKVYALNNKNEIVENLSIRSNKIDEYSTLPSNDFDLVDTENYFNLFINSFEISFNQYNFPIIENDQSLALGGPRISFNSNYLREIFFNGVQFEQNNARIEYLSILLLNQDLQIQFPIKHIRHGNVNLVPFQNTTNSWGRSLLTNVAFKDFVFNLNRHIENNALDEVSLTVVFNLKYNEEVKTLQKNVIIEKSELLDVYNDLLRFRFENDIIENKVIFAEPRRYNESLNNNIKYYSIKISINDSEYSESDITNNRLLINISNERGDSVDITEFYLDDALTEGNDIVISQFITINSYLIDDNFIYLYFSYNDLENIDRCNLKYYLNDEDFIDVGPFYFENSNRDLRSINNDLFNVYLDCERKLSRNLNIIKEDDTTYIQKVLNNNDTSNYEINLLNVLDDNSFKSLSYFQDSSQSQDEKLRSLLNNIIVRSYKKLTINNKTIVDSTTHVSLFSICSIVNENNVVKAVFKNKDMHNIFQNIDLSSRSLSRQNTNDLQNFKQGNFANLSKDFSVSLEESLLFVVFKNNTLNYFGYNESNNDAINSKRNVIDYMIEFNPNYRIQAFQNISLRIYDDQFFEDTSYNLNILVNFIREDYLLNNFNIKSEARKETTNNQQLQNNFQNNTTLPLSYFVIDPSRINDITLQSDINCTTNLLLDIKGKDFLVKHRSSRPAITLSGEKIKYLNKIYKENENESFIIKTIVYPEFEFDRRISSIKNSFLEKHDQIEVFSNQKSIYVTLLKDTIFSQDNNVTIDFNSKDFIHINFKRNKFKFKRYDESFYSILASIISQERNNYLYIKNILLRVFIVININNKNYTILKNVYMKNSSGLKNYVRKNAINASRKNLNISLLDESKTVFMPNIVYEGMRR